MTTIISIYRKQISNKDDELREILEKLTPLEQKKETIEKEIEALKYLVESEQKRIKTTPAVIGQSLNQNVVDGHLVGMTGKEAYRELIKNHYRTQSFREGEIRKLSKEKGLRIKGKEIQRNTSCSIMKDLYKKDDFLEKVDLGLYRYKNSELSQDTNKQKDDEEAQEQRTGRITPFPLGQE